MELYLVDLIKYPELKDSELAELLKGHPESLIRVPDIDTLLTMGRSKFADICLLSEHEEASEPNERRCYQASDKFLEFVSRCHAVLSVKGKYAYVKDAGSRNGTFVNNDLANNWRRLNHGDRLILRPYCFKVLLSEEYRNITEDLGETVDLPERIKKSADLEGTVEFDKPLNGDKK